MRSAARPTGLAVCLVSEGANKRRGVITTLITRITLLPLTHHEPQSHPDNLLLFTQGDSKKKTQKKTQPWSPERRPPPHGSVFIFIRHIQWAQPLLLCQPAVGQHLSTNDHVDINTDKNDFWPSGMHLGNVAYFTTLVLNLMTCETWELIIKNKQRRVAVKPRLPNPIIKQSGGKLRKIVTNHLRLLGLQYALLAMHLLWLVALKPFKPRVWLMSGN